MRAWRVGQPGPMRSGPLRGGRVPRSPAGPRGGAVAGPGVRRVPHRPAPGRGRPRPAAPRRHPGPRSRRRSSRVRAPRHAVLPRRPGRGRLARRDLRLMPLLPARRRRTSASPPCLPGWDRDGGYAELITVAENFAYRLPSSFSDEEAAPLLCAGIIGYRALCRAELPIGGRLGIYGFGGSAHLAAQIALLPWRPRVRDDAVGGSARLALELGATFAGGADEQPPDPLDSAILFAPAGSLVPAALRALDRGGTLAVAGIHLSDIPPLHYDDGAFPGTPAAQCHRQHPGRRRGVLPHRRRDPAAAHHGVLSVLGRGPGPAGPLGGPDHRCGRAADGLSLTGTCAAAARSCVPWVPSCLQPNSASSVVNA